MDHHAGDLLLRQSVLIDESGGRGARADGGGGGVRGGGVSGLLVEGEGTGGTGEGRGVELAVLEGVGVGAMRRVEGGQGGGADVWLLID